MLQSSSTGREPKLLLPCSPLPCSAVRSSSALASESTWAFSAAESSDDLLGDFFSFLGLGSSFIECAFFRGQPYGVSSPKGFEVLKLAGCLSRRSALRFIPSLVPRLLFVFCVLLLFKGVLVPTGTEEPKRKACCLDALFQDFGGEHPEEAKRRE